MESGLINFVRQHHVWAIPIVFILAFGESLAFISLLLPATVILIGLGALIGESWIQFWPVFIAAASGCFFGDWLSYSIGYHYQEQVYHFWPFRSRPAMLKRGYAFFYRWGIASVFIGRFFGPLRAIIPIVAGLCRMPQLWFQVANLSSALIWALVILAPGTFGIYWIGSLLARLLSFL